MTDTPTGPDGLTADQLRRYRSNGDDYPYLDQTRPGLPLRPPFLEAGQAELNPAFYPAVTKPEALRGEDEKAGAQFPAGGTGKHAASQQEPPTRPVRSVPPAARR